MNRPVVLESIVFAILVSATAIVCADVVFPETRVGEIAQEYLASFNSGDPEKVREFETRYRSMAALGKRSLEDRIPRVMGLAVQLGVLEVLQVKEATEKTLTMICKATKPNMFVSVKFELEPEPPHKLEVATMMPSSPPKDQLAKIEWTDLSDLLTQVRAEVDVPALAAAVISDGGTIEHAAVGVRARGGDDAVSPDDCFHLGSVTKSMTATMIGRLVEQGVLSWDATVAGVLDGIDMRDDYREITLEQLLHHRGGIQPYTLFTDEDSARLGQLEGTPTEIRLKFVREVLKREPDNLAGEHSYSNAGYTVAAAMAENAAGQSWEALVKAHVFTGAGLEHAGFGWPATSERPDAPRGHFERGEALVVQAFGAYDLGIYLAPAGDVRASILDLARYARMHLRGMTGHDGTLKAETVKRLHTPPTSDGETGYASGWVVDRSEKMGAVHWHSGSAGTFYAVVRLYPDKNRAVVVATNVGMAKGTAVTNRVIDLLETKVE